MQFVKISKDGETKTVESGAVHIWEMRGWIRVNNESNMEKMTYSTKTSNSSPYYNK